MNFNPQKSDIFRALLWEKFPLFRFADFFKNTCLVLFVLSLFCLGLSYLDIAILNSPLNVAFFFLTSSVVFWEISLFFNYKIKNPALEADISQVDIVGLNYNVADFLDFEAAKIISQALVFCRKRKLSEINVQVLLYSSLEKNPQINYLFYRLGVDSKKLRDNLKNFLEKMGKGDSGETEMGEEFEGIILKALESAKAKQNSRIGAKDILIAVSKTEFFKNILVEADLKKEDFENISLWLDYLGKKIEERKRFWSKENLAVYGSLGKDWASGYTITLDQFSIDWRRNVRKWLYKAIIGHEDALERVQAALVKPEANNVLIIGEPGTGKESIVQGLARRVYLGKSLPELNFARVVELDMVALLTRITNVDQLEDTLDRIFQEVVTAGNIIFVIKDFHNYIGLQQAQPGTADISGIIGKYLKFPEFRFIGITDFNGLHTRIEKNPSLAGMFTKIEISEISEQDTIRILLNNALELEYKYKVAIAYPSIREVVNLSGRYIPNVPFPKKAIELLNDVVVYVARSLKEKLVLPEHVQKIVSTKTEIPVGKVDAIEKQKLLNLENLLHQKIVNQAEAVQEISIAMRRARAGIGSKKRPMGSFMFLGPTGVGKTETSKALAEIYFGGENKMVRLDMSEFQSINDIPRLIGGVGKEGLLTTPVRENPFCLLLLDEIEKAHKNILNLFLQVLDEGYITDGQGRKTVFTNAIIICTSNAGAQYIFESVEKNKELDKDEVLGQLFDNGIFRPEFINRFDAVVLYKPLTQENLLDIAELMLGALKKSLKEKDIEFLITDTLKKKIVELSYKPAYGAREMRRVIQDKVESAVAQALLKDEIKKGESFEIDAENFSIVKK